MIERLGKPHLAVISGLSEIAQGDTGMPIDREAFIFHWSYILENHLGAIFGRIEEGECLAVIGCALEVDLFTGDTMAVETFWYVHPEHRGGSTARRLLDAYDEWAKEKGAKRQFITCHFTQQRLKLDKLYRRRGFKADAVTYARDVDYATERAEVA